MKFIKHDKLNYSLCDTAANLSAVGAFQLVEDAICEMMGNLKLDGETCIREYDAMWVFIKNRLEIHYPIHWMEEYTIECYISNVGGVKLIVDTLIKSHGKIAVASRAELCAIDHNTSRIRRGNTVGLNDTIHSETPEIDIQFDNGDFTACELSDTVVVRSTDIDFYHHNNNVSYIRYIVNQFDTALLHQKPISAIEIKYVSQTFEGDVLKIYRCSDDRFTIENEDKTVVNCIVK